MAKRREIKGHKVRKVTVSIDPVTDAAIKGLVEREGVTYSAAICALATSAALTDNDLIEAMHKVLVGVVSERMASESWHPGLSAILTHEITAT